MAKYNRETLKKYFGSGERPSANSFEHFIDSTVNILDDQFSQKADAPIKVAADGDKRDVISMFRESGGAGADWTISVDTTGDLRISSRKEDEQFRSSLVFKDNGDIEINGRNTWISGSRKGAPVIPQPADGKWHSITEPLSGINILEVTAAYSTGSGKNNTLVAWASQSFGRKRKIRRLRSRSFFFWNNKLKIRWVRVKDKNGHRTKCVLQIRTKYNCGPNSRIQCSITQLWDNSETPD